MIKLTFALTRRPELTRETFQAYWYDHHAPLVASVKEVLRIRRYVQLHSLPPEVAEMMRASRGGPEGYDGVAQLWWDSLEDMAATAGDPAADRSRPDACWKTKEIHRPGTLAALVGRGKGDLLRGFRPRRRRTQQVAQSAEETIDVRLAAEIRTVANIAPLQARVRPDEVVALWFEGRETSFAQLDARANACASALLAAGIKPGERIACLAKNNDDFFVLWLGAVKARACLAPVNWRLAPPEIAFILKDAGAKLLVCGAEFVDVVDMIVSDCPDLHRLIHFDAGHPRWPAFRDWIGAYPATDPVLAAPEDDDVIQLYTSGTTGLPKGVQLTHDNYLAVFRAGCLPGDWADFEAGSTALVAMPLFHVAGVNVGLLAMLQGARSVILREIEPNLLLKLLPQEKVRYAFLVPAVINMLLQTPGVAETDFSHLEQLYYGASPIAEELLLRAQHQFGSSFTQLYGMTETVGGGVHAWSHRTTIRRGASCGLAGGLRGVRGAGDHARRAASAHPARWARSRSAPRA